MSIPVNFKSFEELCPSYVNEFQANALHNSVKNYAGCYLVKKNVDGKTYYKVGYKGKNSNRITHYAVKGITCLGFIFAEEKEKREFDIDIHNKLKAFYGYGTFFEKGVFFGNDEEGCHLQDYKEDDEKFIKDVISACSNYRNNSKPEIKKEWFWGPRIGSQDKCIEKAINWWSKDNCNDYFLIAMKCRGGKSYTTTKIIQELENNNIVNNKLHLITTYRPSDTYKEWYETAIKHADFHFDFYVHPSLLKDCPYAKSLDELNDDKSTGIVFASSQCLSRNIDGDYSKYSAKLQNINWGVVATDEDDIGCNKEKAQEFRSNNVKAEKHIRITGTAYEEIINETDKFNEENTYIWDYIDEQKAKEKYNYLGPNNPYKDMAQIQLYEIDLAKKIYEEDPNGYDNDGFTLNEFFKTDKNDNTKFLHSKQVKRLIEETLDDNKCEDEEAPYSIFDDIKFNFKNVLIKVPTKTIEAFEQMFKELQVSSNYIKNNFVFIKLTGNKPTVKNKEELINLIKKANENDKKTISYTIYKDGRGISIPQWQAILHWSGNETSDLSNYEQFNYRVQTPYKGKEIGYVFDYAPNRILEVQRKIACLHSILHHTDFDESHNEIINYFPAFKYCKINWKKLDYDTIIDELRRTRNEKQLEHDIIEKSPKGFLEKQIIDKFDFELNSTSFISKIKHLKTTIKEKDEIYTPEQLEKYKSIFIKQQIKSEQKNFFEFIKKTLRLVWLRNNGLPFDSIVYKNYIKDQHVKEWLSIVIGDVPEYFDSLLEEAYKNDNWVASFNNFLTLTYDKKEFNEICPIKITPKDFKTNIRLVEKCWSSLGNIKVNNFIQPCTKTGEFAKFGIEQGYIKKENCYFIARNSLCASLTALNIFGDYDYKKFNNNIKISLIEEDEDYIKREFYMIDHFDVAIMNPPYGKMLPYNILNLMIEKGKTDKIVYIGPIGKIYSIVESNEITDNILSHIKTKNSYTQEEFNKLFKILQREESGILEIDCNVKYDNKYLRNELSPIYQKIKSVCKENNIKSIRTYCNSESNTITDYWFYMQGDGGYCKGWYMKPTDIIEAKTDRAPKLYYKNDVCKENFRLSLSAWIYKIIYFIDKKSAIPAHMPFMVDYTKPWDDKRFCEYFGITGYIDDDHAEPGSEWETILKTMEEYK